MTDGVPLDLCDRIKPRILLVDDAPGLRLMVSLCFRARGFEVVEAVTHQSAMAIVDRESVDLVFSDVSAGSTIDGLKFLRWLLQSQPGVPLLVTSSDAKKAQEARKLHPHAVVLSKPYDIDEVAERVRSLLSRARDPLESVPAE